MKLFPAAYVGTEAACGFGLMPEFVVDHHIGIMPVSYTHLQNGPESGKTDWQRGKPPSCLP